MSCPDWRRLDPAERDGASLQAARWTAALHHFDTGCARCRREALAADPSLVFRLLPAAELSAAQEVDEVASARAAVAAMRAASRLGSPQRSGAGTLPRLHRLPGRSISVRQAMRGRHLSRWALAASLTGMALLFGAGHGWRGDVGRAVALLAHAPAAGAPALHRLYGTSAPSTPDAIPAPRILPAASRSSIEGFSRPGARVYEIDGPQMSVVMIVDDKLDV